MFLAPKWCWRSCPRYRGPFLVFFRSLLVALRNDKMDGHGVRDLSWRHRNDGNFMAGMGWNQSLSMSNLPSESWTWWMTCCIEHHRTIFWTWDWTILNHHVRCGIEHDRTFIASGVRPKDDNVKSSVAHETRSSRLPLFGRFIRKFDGDLYSCNSALPAWDFSGRRLWQRWCGFLGI